MKQNWLVIHVVVGTLLAFASGHAAEPSPLEPSKLGLDSLGFPTNSLIAAELGRADATRDVEKGLLRIPMFGLPTDWSSDFNRILAEEHGVQRYGLGGCLVSDGLNEYARGYSEISDPAIERKFGTNFLQQVQAQAKLAYEKRVQEMAATAAAKREVAAQASNRTYRVKAGDTLWDIARQQRVALSSLLAANPGIKPERLQINHSLNLPSVGEQ